MPSAVKLGGSQTKESLGFEALFFRALDYIT